MPPSPGSAEQDAPDASSEIAELRAEAAFHERLRDLTVAFSRDASSTLTVASALRRFVLDTSALFGARRTSVWLHQRRARELTLAATSDDALPEGARVSTDDIDAPPVRGMRLEYPDVRGTRDEPMLLAPLRGWRRALGTLVLEGPFGTQLDPRQLGTVAHELGRQLAAALENIQLLEEILRQRRLLEDTFNSIVDLVLVTDSQLRVVQVNEAFLARVGRSREEVHEQPIDRFVCRELAGWVAALDVAPGAAPDEARTQLFEDPLLGGILSVTATPLIRQSDEPAGHVLVARDMTHQTRLEQEREALRERLSQSQKLAALGQFVAGIAHEMNNPLQGVLGHLELLIETSEAARPLKRDLRRIYQDADRAAKIVRNLLAFTGSHRMSRRRMKLDRILSRAITSRQAALDRAGITVVRDVPETLPPVVGDALLLHQAFLNVLMNAEHAIAAAGHGGRIEIRAFPDAASVRTTIRDTGPGIPAQALPQIFDPFFTTKEVGKGTGLGLAITYGIVQDHGGTIYAANAPGGGAIFTVDLPAAPAA
jgi:two-component system NtrC family sensor kinase